MAFPKGDFAAAFGHAGTVLGGPLRAKEAQTHFFSGGCFARLEGFLGDFDPTSHMWGPRQGVTFAGA